MSGVCFVDCDHSITLYEHTVPYTSINYTFEYIVAREELPISFHGGFLGMLSKLSINTQCDHLCEFFILEQVRLFDNVCVIEDAHTKHFSLREVSIDKLCFPNLSKVQFSNQFQLITSWQHSIYLSIHPFLFFHLQGVCSSNHPRLQGLF